MVVIDGHDICGRLRPGGAVETETFAGGEVVIRRDSAREIHGGLVFAHLLGLGEDRHPQEHLDPVRMQVLPDLPVDIPVQAPADNHFLDRNLLTHFPDPVDDLFRRIIGRMPAAQGNLDDETSLLRFGLAGRRKEQAGQEIKDPSHSE